MTPLFLLALLAVAVLSGAAASLAGFGIGSLLTPLVAIRFGDARRPFILRACLP